MGALLAGARPQRPDAGWARSERLLADPAESLRSASAALARGDRARALWLYGEIEVRHPVIGDYAALLAAQALVDAGRAADAASAALEAVSRHGQSPLVGRFQRILGDARDAAGDAAGARAAWQAALDATSGRSERGELRWRIGRSLEAAGRIEAATEQYEVLWTGHPSADFAAEVAARLDALEGAGLVEVRDARGWRRRGDRLFRERDNEGALAAYERAEELGLTGSEALRLARQRAHTLFRLRRYPLAVKAFRSLPQKDDVPIWYARSLARAGDVMRAVDEFDELARRGRGSISLRASFLAGLLLDGRDRIPESRERFERVAHIGGRSGLANAALWRLAWASYREGRHADAVRFLEQLVANEQDDPIGALRARYWRARSLEQQGAAAAVEAFRSLATEFPLSYYGWRSRARLAALERGASPGGAAGVGPGGAAPPTPAPVSAPATGRRSLRPHDVARARILVQAGLIDEAHGEIRRLARRARGLDDRLELAELSSDAGDFHRAQRLVVDPYSTELARGPSKGYEALWWHAWPTAFGDYVEAETRGDGTVEPELVYAIMREESGYRPAVVSPVGARGLLQIMSETGERLSRSLGRADFHPDELFDPAVNVRLGAHYLARLSTRFEGALSAAIASYNAGPQAVAGWRGADAPAEDDEWVEAIPYEQTRSYVKRVLRSVHSYRVLY